MPISSMLHFIPRSLIPLLTQKVLRVQGKHVMRKAWRSLKKQVQKGKLGTLTDSVKINKIQEKEVMIWIEEGRIDIIDSLLENAGLSSKLVIAIASELQKEFMGLAKTNSIYFYEFMVEAEREQLEGIQQLKEALGLDIRPIREQDQGEIEQGLIELLESIEDNIIKELGAQHDYIREDTSMILQNQELVIDLLKEIREHVALTNNLDLRLENEFGQHNDLKSGGIFQKIQELLNRVINDLGTREYEVASKDLFRSAFLLFNMYKVVKQRRYYELGNQCYLLANALLIK